MKMKVNLSRRRCIVDFIAPLSLYVLALGLFTGCGISTPFVPVVITLRQSLWGEGMVAIFSNQTPNRLTISVTVRNDKLNQSKSVNINLDPNGNGEFGWLEGWRFLSGETIIVSHPSYLPLIKTVP